MITLISSQSDRPASGPLHASFGFRTGDIGTHTSRTIMLVDLAHLLAVVPPAAERATYLHATVEDNALGKPTLSSRKLTIQRLTELYALDPKVTLFRVLRRFWDLDDRGRPLLALLCALGRDPLLRATASTILAMKPGEELARQKLTEAIREAAEKRLNDSTLDKVVRNASSSWTQSGHLLGRGRKVRQLVLPTPAATAYALALGYLQGFRGQRLFQTLWTRTLDATTEQLMSLAIDAKRLSMLDLKLGGDVIEVNFTTTLTPEERQLSHGSH